MFADFAMFFFQVGNYLWDTLATGETFYLGGYRYGYMLLSIAVIDFFVSALVVKFVPSRGDFAPPKPPRKYGKASQGARSNGRSRAKSG